MGVKGSKPSLAFEPKIGIVKNEEETQPSKQKEASPQVLEQPPPTTKGGARPNPSETNKAAVGGDIPLLANSRNENNNNRKTITAPAKTLSIEEMEALYGGNGVYDDELFNVSEKEKETGGGEEDRPGGHGLSGRESKANPTHLTNPTTCSSKVSPVKEGQRNSSPLDLLSKSGDKRDSLRTPPRDKRSSSRTPSPPHNNSHNPNQGRRNSKDNTYQPPQPKVPPTQQQRRNSRERGISPQPPTKNKNASPVKTPLAVPTPTAPTPTSNLTDEQKLAIRENSIAYVQSHLFYGLKVKVRGSKLDHGQSGQFGNPSPSKDRSSSPMKNGKLNPHSLPVMGMNHDYLSDSGDEGFAKKPVKAVVDFGVDFGRRLSMTLMKKNPFANGSNASNNNDNSNNSSSNSYNINNISALTNHSDYRVNSNNNNNNNTSYNSYNSNNANGDELSVCTELEESGEFRR